MGGSEQILHFKVGCSDSGPVRDRGSLPYDIRTFDLNYL